MAAIPLSIGLGALAFFVGWRFLDDPISSSTTISDSQLLNASDESKTLRLGDLEEIELEDDAEFRPLRGEFQQLRIDSEKREDVHVASDDRSENDS